MGRRSYAGGAVTTFLTAPVIETDITFLIDSSAGWPTGLNGPMAAVIDRGEPNEEKVLLSEVNAGTAVVSIRGYDGTTAKTHAAFATFELCITGIDADEANAHVNAVSGVHGLAPTDRVVGEARAATLTNKNISGTDNTLTAIPRAASPQTDAALTALQAELDQEQIDRTAQDVLLQSNINAEALARGNADTALQGNIDAEALTRGNADTAHVAAVDPHAQYATAAEVAAAIAADQVDSGFITSIAGFVNTAGWDTLSVRYRTVTQGGVTQVQLFFRMLRDGGNIAIPTTGNLTNISMVTVPLAIRPSGTEGGFGPGNGEGRACSFNIQATGVLSIANAGGTGNIANNDPITGTFTYYI